jgi:FixJ family two-component response regulator
MSTTRVVYVVDDDASFRTAVTRMLTAAGLSVQSYSSGTELLAHLSEQVVHGSRNKQIAAALSIHERTVKLHRNAITTKLGVRSVAELTTLTREIGLFEAPQQSCP